MTVSILVVDDESDVVEDRLARSAFFAQGPLQFFVVSRFRPSVVELSAPVPFEF